ncbi:PhaM family polyhydroxyalkanoate granule multifunctional regulatory protein [Paludibacterium yongneupense]|uniref:PhaM family polyhydroxyalkanoate granule multifunctional regulatory protein n=1 Tax=Paludibacterium yongneupense TaxID=400061 RepID=UPI0003F8AA91|nr:PhaM family polyhydroxyalkanoate granule multifunctional regulatory protein [Paludibacterium yongneupense]
MNAEFNPSDPFALFRQMLQNVAPPGSQAFLPPLNEAEIDRKIGELKVIEGWLTLNLGMLSMQIKTLEMQKAGLAALKPKNE